MLVSRASIDGDGTHKNISKTSTGAAIKLFGCSGWVITKYPFNLKQRVAPPYCFGPCIRKPLLRKMISQKKFQFSSTMQLNQVTAFENQHHGRSLAAKRITKAINYKNLLFEKVVPFIFDDSRSIKNYSRF